MKFLFSRHGGNNVFIDDINIEITTGTKDITEILNTVTIFPNPASNFCNIKFNVSQTKTLAIHIFNLLGEKVLTGQNLIYNEGEHVAKLNTLQFANGIYIVQLNDGTRAINKQLIISN